MCVGNADKVLVVKGQGQSHSKAKCILLAKGQPSSHLPVVHSAVVVV